MRYTFIIVIAATLFTACHKKPETSQKPPTILVQTYQIDGETFLPPEKLSAILTNNTGAVGIADISLKMKKLQEVYRQAGYTNVKVVLPPQRFTNGVVHLKVLVVDKKDETP
jgi:hemolysin activation/secretion protein